MFTMSIGQSDTETGDSSGGDVPVLANNQEGAAAWVNTDKNGQPYLSVRLPLGLGSVNLFPENDAVITALNHVLDEA